MDSLILILIGTLFSSAMGIAASDRENRDAWLKLIDFADGLISQGETLAGKKVEDQLGGIVDLHAKFCGEILGKPIPSERVVIVKQGFNLFFKLYRERYSGDNKPKVFLRLLRDIATNRSLFTELFNSQEPAEVLSQQILAYMERNQSLAYDDPQPVGEQLAVPPSQTDLRIDWKQVRLVADLGTSGHANRVIDAGETISINVPLTNSTPDRPYRSTSGFLQCTNQFVRVDVSEVIYSEKKEVGGETITFAPGTTITPRENYTFTILPDCPDGLVVPFELLVWDTDRGKFTVPFTIKVYNVGPLDFGTIRVDDDIPGLSDGNDNQKMEGGETIEYVLALSNRGAVRIDDVAATLMSPSGGLVFREGYDALRYKLVHPNAERPIPASFVFTLKEDAPEKLVLRLFAQGRARGHRYSWLRTQVHEVGLSDAAWAKMVEEVRQAWEAKNGPRVMELLANPRAVSRVAADREVQAIHKSLLAQIEVHVKNGKTAQENGDYTAAIRELNAALELNPEHAEAKQALAAAVEAQSARIEIHLGNAKAALERDDYAAARGELDAVLTINPKDRQAKNLMAQLKAREARTRAMGVLANATKENPFTNSLGMKFVPVQGTEALFCVWETRVQDYQAFADATGRSWKKPSFEHGPTHPAVNVSWEDAKAFCEWLTRKERSAGLIGANQSYRLPTDAEWSAAVGLAGETGDTPKEKDAKIKGVYPWGNQWPPPRGAGNYDSSLNVDSFKFTSPVGSFDANQFGLYDLGGNVWEWCEDWYDSEQKYRVLRGGSWDADGPGALLSSRRGLGTPDLRNVIRGFRVVLAGVSSR